MQNRILDSSCCNLMGIFPSIDHLSDRQRLRIKWRGLWWTSCNVFRLAVFDWDNSPNRLTGIFRKLVAHHCRENAQYIFF